MTLYQRKADVMREIKQESKRGVNALQYHFLP